MLKRKWGAESNRSYRTYPSLVKLKPMVPEFAMEGLSLGRIAALVPEFAVKDLPLGRTLMMMIIGWMVSWFQRFQVFTLLS